MKRALTLTMGYHPLIPPLCIRLPAERRVMLREQIAQYDSEDIPVIQRFEVCPELVYDSITQRFGEAWMPQLGAAAEAGRQDGDATAQADLRSDDQLRAAEAAIQSPQASEYAV